MCVCVCVYTVLPMYPQECVDMSARLLDASSRKPLLEIVEAKLLLPHLAPLVERGFKVRTIVVYGCNMYCSV